MSRIVGIDIRQNLVQAALLRSSYRRVHLEGLAEVDVRNFDSLSDAVRAVVSGFGLHGESFAVGIPGDSAYIHRLELPPAALKQVEEVVPFELEAQIPVEFDELVYDSRVLPRQGAESKIDVIAAAAPVEAVRSRIAEMSAALGHEPERVGVGALPLANLASLADDVEDERYCAFLDLGDSTSELVVVHQGVAVFGRTVSVGVAGLPDSASDMVRELRQTLVSWATTSGSPVEALYLCGGGAMAVGMVEYLSAHLQVAVARLPRLALESLQPEHAAQLPRFAKAIALALALRAGSKDLNLRQGELVYQRGYGFLRDKVPLLAGLGALMLLSFLFSAWAESRALAQENETLSETMAILSREILREETDDVERVLELLDTGTKNEKDPQPEIDGFELAIALAEQIPKDFEHDIAELDLQRAHVNLRGVVNSTEQAQKIVEALEQKRCFKNVKVSKISQEIKGNRQKYSMEFDIRCEDPPKKLAAADTEED
jgi:general secretion pathway protein L